ncbi:MAG TPA: hypothetical protein VIA98_00685 [Allosphingosinicella sp.]|jgi:hypothetical protein
MRLLSSLLVVAAMISPAAGQAASRRAPEAQLQDEIAGKVAGEPVDCIDSTHIRSMRVIDGTAIVYEIGRITYVNRPASGARSLDRWDTLVTESHSSQLCSRDTVRLVDSASRMQTGLVFLGKFIPYRKADRASR